MFGYQRLVLQVSVFGSVLVEAKTIATKQNEQLLHR